MTSGYRYNTSKLALLYLTLISSIAGAARVNQSGVIKNCKRSLALLEPDVVIYTNDIDFKPDEEYSSGQKTVFQYVVAADYEDTLVSIEARDATTLQQPISTQRLERAIYFDEKATEYNETDFIWFEVDITEQYKVSKDGMVHLELTEYHKRRRNPFPESVALIEK